MVSLKEYMDMDFNEGGFVLPKLPYAYNALEPYIDAETMKEHHNKHEQKYVDNLNKELGENANLGKSIEEICTNIGAYSRKVRNNAGGVFNHEFFWSLLSAEKTKTSNELTAEIARTWGSLEDFQEQFKQAGLDTFGSGWVWLVQRKDELVIVSTANQDNPLMMDMKPIIGCDVWEHAYYLKHKSDRGKWIDTFFKVLNWEQANINYKK
jgi:Fe-Mn family superoxide dismutase